MRQKKFEVRKDLIRTQQGKYYLPAVREMLTGVARHNLPDGMQRALILANQTSGGFLAAPTEMADRLVGVVTDRCFIRQLVAAGGNVFTLTKAESFEAPTVTGGPDDSDWTPEINTINDDNGLTFGNHVFTPHPITKAVLVSNKLLRSSAIPAEEIVIDRVGYKHAVAEEKAFLTGSGVQQPLGVFTPHIDGIPASQDIISPDMSVAILDYIRQAKFNLKAQYMARAQWICHRNFLEVISKLRDGDGNYIYTEASNFGDPDLLCGLPLNLSEYAPGSGMNSGDYVCVLADFGAGYGIVDLVEQEIKILSELYALNSKTGVIVRREVDGAPVLGEAFARIRLA